jgi:holo-[acyl-carrier protein] synthase
VILGIGIDVVEVKRMKSWENDNDLLQRFFHPDEIRESRSRGSSAVLSLAARFAAKEAFGKALGTGLRGIALSDIQVRNNDLGKPEMILHATARRALDTLGASCVHVSMSHEAQNALAMVVIEE